MLNEQDYRAVLEELGFDLQGPSTGTRGPALRHTIRRFIRIPDRPPGSDDAFWPSLYWHRHGESATSLHHPVTQTISALSFGRPPRPTVFSIMKYHAVSYPCRRLGRGCEWRWRASF